MRKADNLPPSCAVLTQSGSLNFLEYCGPVQACNGTDLPLHLPHTSAFGLSNSVSQLIMSQQQTHNKNIRYFNYNVNVGPVAQSA